MSRLPAVLSNARSAARTRRLLSGGSAIRHAWTCSEAKIIMLEIQLLVGEFAGLGCPQDFDCPGLRKQVHRLHDGFIILDRQQNRNRLVTFGDQNASGLAT